MKKNDINQSIITFINICNTILYTCPPLLLSDEKMEKPMYINFNRCLSVFNVKRKKESLYQRLKRYLDEAHRDGVIGEGLLCKNS